jgi:hypothetical protein
MVKGCYDLFVSLLPNRSEKGQLEHNALSNYVLFQLSQVRSWLLATLNALALSGAPSISEEEQKYFILKYFRLACLDLGEKVLKYHLNYLFCRASRQTDLDEFVLREKPPCEQGLDGYLFGGRSMNWLHRNLFLKKFNKKSACIAYTLLQSKRAWNPISRGLVTESLKKHRKALCEPKELPINGMLLEEVKRTVREVIPKRDYSFSERVPSSSSHFDSTRREGGAQGYLSEYLVDRDHFLSTELIGYVEVGHKPMEVRGFPRNNRIVSKRENDLVPLRNRYARALIKIGLGIFELEFDGFEDQFEAEVHVVLEPAKARIITAGPVVSYHRARIIQKAIHNQLRNHETFSLIGSPLTSEIMENFSKKCSHMRGDYYYMSADYSAATDNLRPELIMACAEQICVQLGLDEFDSEIYKHSLLKHKLIYPEIKDPRYMAREEGDEVEQIEDGYQCSGQLMGSPSSFPVLCLINAAINRFFYESTIGRRYIDYKGESTKFYHKYKLKQIPMLVNGDDLLMTINPSDYKSWWEMVRSCGLEPSLGKNYVSKDFAMINSQLWLENRDCFFSHSYWHFVPFINLGLLKGQSKVLSDTRKGVKATFKASDLVSNAEALLHGFTGTEREEIYSLYLRLNSDKIKSVCFPKQNWFIPRQLGGLGLPLPERFSVTRGQAKLASYLKYTTEIQKIPSLRTVKPAYLREEDKYMKDIYDLIEFEWKDEKSPDPYSFTRYFEALSSEENEDGSLEQELDVKNTQLKWNRLWTVGTNHRIDQMGTEEMRAWRTRYRVPKANYAIRSFTNVESRLFEEPVKSKHRVLKSTTR